jgi:anti-anti-sigma factor
MTAKTRLVVQTIKDVTVVTFADSSLVDTLHIDQAGRELYELVDKQDRRKLVIDLSKLTHLSSAVLSVFIALQKKIDGAGGTLILCGLSKPLQKLFKVANLHKLFTFTADEDTAMEKLGVVIA